MKLAKDQPLLTLMVSGWKRSSTVSRTDGLEPANSSYVIDVPARSVLHFTDCIESEKKCNASEIFPITGHNEIGIRSSSPSSLQVEASEPGTISSFKSFFAVVRMDNISSEILLLRQLIPDVQGQIFRKIQTWES